jgi:hypothetical protein
VAKLLNVLKALTLAVYAMVGAAALLLLVQVSSMAKHADVAVSSTSAQLNGVLAGAGKTLDQVNRPCKGAAGPDACGTLAQLNKTAIDIGNITIATQMQVSQTGKLIAHSAELLDGIAVDVHGEMAEAQRATQGVTEATQQASALLEAGKPVLVAAAKATEDVDALVLDPDLGKTLGNVQRVTASSAAIAEDARIEADKLTHPDKRKLGFWATADATVLWIHSHVLPPIF